MTRRAYLEFTDGRQTHYRRAGAGEPLILLHPSPLSSAWMEPVIEVLQDIADAIAPDTPGYGASDPLPVQSVRFDGNERRSEHVTEADRNERPSDKAVDAGRNGQRSGSAGHADRNGQRSGSAAHAGWNGQRSGATAHAGRNERKPGSINDLTPYIQWLHEFILALGFRQVGLYGSATGAQIAIEFARTYPEATRFVVLDNVAHFTAEEREGMLARYFPDLSPRADGSHLLTAWTMVSGLWQWFPWYRQDEDHRIAEPGAVPPEAIQRMLVDHLRAGPDYARAYRAAMRNEDASRVLGIAVPVRIIRWEGGLLRRYADRFDGFRWPDHIRLVPCGSTMEERLNAIRLAVSELGAATVSAAAPATGSAPR